MECDQPLDYADPMQIVAALLFLVTKVAHSDDARLSTLIIEHLDLLARHASPLVPALLRDVSYRLGTQWQIFHECREEEWAEGTSSAARHGRRLVH